MFPLPNPSQILPTHLHVLILSLKNEKAIKKLSKQKKKAIQNKMKPKSHKNPTKTWSSFCAGQLLANILPAPECGW